MRRVSRRGIVKSQDRSTALAAIGCAMALALAGCGGVTVVSQPYYDYSFASSELGYAGGFGPIPVRLSGSPFAGERAGQDIVAAINAHRSSPPFFAAPGVPTGSPYSLILAFGQAGSNVNYCAAGGDLPPATASSTQITGTFCLGTRLRSQAVVTAAPAAQANDPQVGEAVQSLVTALLSPDMDVYRRRGLSSANARRR